MWTITLLRSVLRSSDAHSRLMEQRCTLVHKDRMWINGYEYGLFLTPRDAAILGETMHIHGLMFEDVVSEFMHALALTYGHAENILCMERVDWNIQVVEGIITRADAHFILLREHGLNGYEYIVLHDVHACVLIGKLMRQHNIPIHKVIRFSVFRQSFTENIKALFGL